MNKRNAPFIALAAVGILTLGLTYACAGGKVSLEEQVKLLRLNDAKGQAENAYNNFIAQANQVLTQLNDKKLTAEQQFDVEEKLAVRQTGKDPATCHINLESMQPECVVPPKPAAPAPKPSTKK